VWWVQHGQAVQKMPAEGSFLVLMGPEYLVIDGGGPDPPREGALLREISGCGNKRTRGNTELER